MRKIILTMLVAFAFVLNAAAQVRIVTGKVTDEKGVPVPNASVIIKGTENGTATSVNGTFSLSVPPKAILVISSIEMGSKEVTVGNNTTLVVTMNASQKFMQEVVVTGYGTTRKKRDEAGAISSVLGSQLENKPTVSVDKALQGKAAGVFVQSNNGIPGGAINVRIRGAGSINAGNDPLYIVDGIQLNTRSDAGFTQSNPLSFLSNDDIQSIDIMKDAATSAIYGSNAANGVVLITTKKGRSGKFCFTAIMVPTSP
jgi:TonB-dependent SusC/RagA subfamily outer membrane receptor